MRFLLAVVLAASSASVNADLVATNAQHDELRLMPTKCVNAAILAHIDPANHNMLRKGQATLGGRTAALCWVDIGDGNYYILIESGGVMAVPITHFLEVPGV